MIRPPSISTLFPYTTLFRSRKGVVLSADVFGQLLKSFRGQVLVAFEHHVFEQMREPAALIRVVLGTNVIPNLNGDGWTGMIFNRVNLQTVSQRTMFEG